MNLNSKKPFVRRDELAELLNINPHTLDKWEIPFAKVGRVKLYDMNDVMLFLSKKKECFNENDSVG